MATDDNVRHLVQQELHRPNWSEAARRIAHEKLNRLSANLDMACDKLEELQGDLHEAARRSIKYQLRIAELEAQNRDMARDLARAAPPETDVCFRDSITAAICGVHDDPACPRYNLADPTSVK